MEWLFEIIFLGIMSLPGGFIRWVIFRKKPLKNYITDDPYLNIFPLVFVALVFILIFNFC